MKQSWIIGNWKMHKTTREALEYLERFLPLIKGREQNVGLIPSFFSLSAVSERLRSTPLLAGAQNMHEARDGAFTGEVSALMLKEAGASFVLLGHSERRHVFHEGLAQIHAKLKRALQEDLRPLLCVGETELERLEGQTKAVLEKQLGTALEGIEKQDLETLLVAYEPVWAIGTGKRASLEEIKSAHQTIQAQIKKLLGKKVPILYGGSVNEENVETLVALEEVDGVLVGGASLDPESFALIVQKIYDAQAR